MNWKPIGKKVIDTDYSEAFKVDDQENYSITRTKPDDEYWFCVNHSDDFAHFEPVCRVYSNDHIEKIIGAILFNPKAA